VAFSTTAGRAKLLNLQRDARCSLMVSKEDWWGYIVFEGKAAILSRDNTPADELRDALRDVYRAATGGDHSNWPEYDQAMVDDRRAAVIVVPDQILRDCGLGNTLGLGIHYLSVQFGLTCPADVRWHRADLSWGI